VESVVCGITKTQLVSKAIGGSFLNSATNNLSFKLHLPGHSFSGPGTKLDED